MLTESSYKTYVSGSRSPNETPIYYQRKYFTILEVLTSSQRLVQEY
jgi:hypothetical protein